jgi:4a-hydroxytetrahydrobiopterin dehydratase
MNRIGWMADEIQHHPEWTLSGNKLHINLSTHDIGNNISLKDYILAAYIEKILTDKS